jgi:hypothetical protein
MYMYYNIRQHSPLFNSFNFCILLSFQLLLWDKWVIKIHIINQKVQNELLVQ